MNSRLHLKLVGLVAALGVMATGLVFAACGDDASGPGAATTGTPSADLRVVLNSMLAEHVSLAANATGAAAAGRQREFEAAAAALDANSFELAKTIGSVYGPNAEAGFLAGWRRHIGIFVDYTNATVTKDEAKRAQALVDINVYAVDLAELLHAANGMPRDTVMELVKSHWMSLAAVIDAQVAGDQAQAYVLLREATAHMKHLADPLAEATVAKFPGKFKG